MRHLTFALIVLGVFGQASPLFGQSPHIVGTWKQKLSTGGKSEWKLTKRPDGTYKAEETGLGNSRGTATFKDGVLTIWFGTFEKGKSQPGNMGYYEWRIKGREARGKVIFTRWPADWTDGTKGSRDGRPVFIQESTGRRVGG